MSELTPNDLVEEIELEFEDAGVVPSPIDPTLTVSGMAADAKATGDAVAAAVGKLRINGKAPSSNAVTLYGSDVPVSNAAGAPTVAAAIEAAAGRTANDIMYDAAEMITVRAAIDGIKTEIDTELTNDQIDAIFESVFGGDE